MLQDITEELWTGKGAEVQVGPTFSRFCWKSVRDRDKRFKDILFQKLSEEGYFSIDGMGHIREASLTSVRQNDVYHELEFQLSGDMGGPYSKYPPYPFDMRIGAEFQQIRQERYRLKIFPKVRTQCGVMRLATEQNPDLIAEFIPTLKLMYWLLQQEGYVQK